MNWLERRGVRLAVCAIVAALLYLPGLGRPALWEPDEGRYAEIAREMLLSRDYVTPHDDWVRYFEKPPLVYWLTAASLDVVGRNELAARLPAALSSIGQVVITMALAEVMFDAAAGAWAALCLALSPLFFGFGRFLTLDPTLSMFVAGSLAAFYVASRNIGTRSARRWLYLGAALAALGTLTKGPVALVLGAGVAGGYLLLSGRRRDLRAIPWLRCATIYLLIALPWFVLASYRNPGFLRFFFVHEHLERYAVSTEHDWGPFFLAAVALVGTWPWIAFVPGALKEFFRPLKTPDAATASSRDALLFNLLWFGVVLIFFSIPRSKLGSYILPAIPAVAIMAGYGIRCLARAAKRPASIVFSVVALVNSMVAVGAIFAAPRIAELRGVPALRHDLWVAVGGLVAGSVAALAISRIGRVRVAVGAMALGVAVTLGAAVAARRDSDGLESYRELAHIVSEQLTPGCVMASYHHHVQALPFYTGWREALVGFRGELRPWSGSPGAAASFVADDQALRRLWSSGNCVVMVANQKDLPHLYALLSPRPRDAGSEGKKHVLVNR